MTICMKGSGLARALAALVLVLAFAAAEPVCAKDKSEWKVKGRLVGSAKSEDVSGIACATDKGFPRTCVVIDDNLQAAQVVTLHKDKIKTDGQRMIPLINDRFDNAPVELDGEGVAFTDGYFYVIGSHGGPRDPDTSNEEVLARRNASSKIVRFKLNADGTAATELAASANLATLIANEPEINAHRDDKLESDEGGITIEGIAVLKDRLFAGFRGPVIKKDGEKRAAILSAKLGYFFGDESFEIKNADAKLKWLKLGEGRGVRDLAAYGDGMFILAGPVKSMKGTYSVFWWNGSSDTAKPLKDLPGYFKDKIDKKSGKVEKEQLKPEALLPLDRDAKEVRVLLLLDSAKEGEPHAVRVPYP